MPGVVEPGSSRSGKKGGTNYIGLAVFAAAGVVCCTLGYWQLQRRQWKQGLIDSRTKRLFEQKPVDLLSLFSEQGAGTTAEGGDDEDIQFSPVTIRGKMHYEDEQYIGMRKSPESGSIEKGETMGAFAVTPVTLTDGSVVLVNRGWIPRDCLGRVFAEKEESDGTVALTGVIKNGEAKPGYITGGAEQRANNCELDSVFLWADLDEIAAKSNVSVAEGTSPLMVEITGPESPGQYPVRKRKEAYTYFYTTPVTHYMYAFTWFSLAAGIAALGKYRFMGKGARKVLKQAKKKASVS
jgi:surfeit locus 1 family protein